MILYRSDNLTAEPLIKINEWLQEAIKSDVTLPHAMNLSTVDSLGQPSSRIVLLKSLTDEGITFHTDYNSHKGVQLKKNPKAALNFWWATTAKQIRIEGVCFKNSSNESDSYFQSRPRGSQISAAVSRQSETIESYKSLVRNAKELEESRMGIDIERPERWGGFKLSPSRIEFWVNESNRLHRREVFTLQSNTWNKTLLSP